MYINLKINEVKVLKQLTSLKYCSIAPFCEFDCIAEATKLTIQEVKDAITGLHNNPNYILKKVGINENPIGELLFITNRTYEISARFS